MLKCGQLCLSPQSESACKSWDSWNRPSRRSDVLHYSQRTHLVYHSIVIRVEQIEVNGVGEYLIHIKCHRVLTSTFSWTWASRLYTNGFHVDIPNLLSDGKTWLNYSCITNIEGTKWTLCFSPINNVMHDKLSGFCTFSTDL